MVATFSIMDEPQRVEAADVATTFLSIRHVDVRLNSNLSVRVARPKIFRPAVVGRTSTLGSADVCQTGNPMKTREFCANARSNRSCIGASQEGCWNQGRKDIGHYGNVEDAYVPATRCRIRNVVDVG